MEPQTQQHLLGIHVHLGKFGEEQNQIRIDFQTAKQATCYHQLIAEDPFVKKHRLDPYVSDNKHVWMCLPSNVEEIVASTRCKGFYLKFDTSAYAGEWQKALYLWKSLGRHEDILYIDRDIGRKQLADLLGMEPPEVPDTMQEVPRGANSSKKGGISRFMS